jgi:hypothetical protein
VTKFKSGAIYQMSLLAEQKEKHLSNLCKKNKVNFPKHPLSIMYPNFASNSDYGPIMMKPNKLPKKSEMKLFLKKDKTRQPCKNSHSSKEVINLTIPSVDYQKVSRIAITRVK